MFNSSSIPIPTSNPFTKPPLCGFTPVGTSIGNSATVVTWKADPAQITTCPDYYKSIPTALTSSLHATSSVTSGSAHINPGNIFKFLVGLMGIFGRR